MTKLFHSVDSISKRAAKYQEHGTPIGKLIDSKVLATLNKEK